MSASDLPTLQAIAALSMRQTFHDFSFRESGFQQVKERLGSFTLWMCGGYHTLYESQEIPVG